MVGSVHIKIRFPHPCPNDEFKLHHTAKECNIFNDIYNHLLRSSAGFLDSLTDTFDCGTHG